MRRLFASIALVTLFAATPIAAHAAGRKRAVLVGINDYSASGVDTRNRSAAVPGRDWPDLTGAVNDVEAIAEMLVLVYGFERRDIVTLTDQTAARATILQSIEKNLVQPAKSGDVLFLYYAGHGSQVRNSSTNEPDGLDESIVPADSKAGAPDIRDKELRPLFNRMLDRGARLTIVFDACHSGSGARGLATGAHPRGVQPDLRDVADASDYGPRPEDRGALVISASRDFDLAWETRDASGLFHGAFSWALLRALRDAPPGESASETFLRAAARLRAETPFQEPVLAGAADARRNPFLGVRTDRRTDRTVVAIQKVRADGTVVLQGGWANGLDVGTQLQFGTTRLTITSLEGLGTSRARLRSGPALQSGALVEVVGWAAPPTRPLRVWMPRIAMSARTLTSLARSIAAQAMKRGVHWVSDPIETTPTHLLRRANEGWELIDRNNRVQVFANRRAAIANVPAGASLFVQFPAPSSIVDAIAVGPGSDREDIAPVDRAQDADYILTGRYVARTLTYAWLRPCVRSADRRKTGLPLRTQWIGDDDRALALRDAVLRLRRIQGWHLLESPPNGRSPYRLGMRRLRNGELLNDPILIGDERYELTLRAAATPLPQRVTPRSVYVFTIDSFGRSLLLFPASGSVENRFPLASEAPSEIRLGDAGSFEVSSPFGVDTFFLLTTDEPLPNPWILEWDGVRTRSARPMTGLEQLLALTAAGSRGKSSVTPSNWSIERVLFESIPSRHKRQPKVSVSATFSAQGLVARHSYSCTHHASPRRRRSSTGGMDGSIQIPAASQSDDERGVRHALRAGNESRERGDLSLLGMRRGDRHLPRKPPPSADASPAHARHGQARVATAGLCPAIELRRESVGAVAVFRAARDRAAGV